MLGLTLTGLPGVRPRRYVGRPDGRLSPGRTKAPVGATGLPGAGQVTTSQTNIVGPLGHLLRESVRDSPSS